MKDFHLLNVNHDKDFNIEDFMDCRQTVDDECPGYPEYTLKSTRVLK